MQKEIFEITYTLTMTLMLFYMAMLVRTILDITLQRRKEKIVEKQPRIRVGFGRQRVNSWPL